MHAVGEAFARPEHDDVESRAPSAQSLSRLEWLCALDWKFLWSYHFVRIITGIATLLGITIMIIFLAQRTLSTCPALRNNLFTAPAPTPLASLMADWPREPFWGIDAACQRNLGELLEQRLVDLKDMAVLCAIDYGVFVPVCAVRDGGTTRVLYRPEIEVEPDSPHSALNEDMTFFPAAAPVPMIRFDRIRITYVDPRTGARNTWVAADPRITHILQQVAAVHADRRSIYDEPAAKESIL